MIPLTAAMMPGSLAIPASVQPTALDQGYQQMYNLNFAAAHRAFADWEKTHPNDPMGAVSDALKALRTSTSFFVRNNTPEDSYNQRADYDNTDTPAHFLRILSMAFPLASSSTSLSR